MDDTLPLKFFTYENISNFKKLGRYDDKEEIQEDVPYKKVQPDMAVISTLVQGSGFQRARIGAAIQGNCFPSKSTFYRHKQKLIPKIKECTSEHFERFAKETFE